MNHTAFITLLAATLPDWLCMAGSWLLLIAGLALLLWSLFWDRARGRRRCPKCWYDMAGVPGLRCPECGREARSERGLQRTRRRWWVAALAVVVAAGGVCAAFVPKVRRDGWWSIVPTTVVIAGLPRAGEEMRWDKAASEWIENGFASEMANRVAAGKVRDWQMQWALGRVGLLRTRPSWREDEPVHVGIWSPRWLPGGVTAKPLLPGCRAIARLSGMGFSGTLDHYHKAFEQYQEIGFVPMGTERLEFEITTDPGASFRAIRRSLKVPHWRGWLSIPVKIVPVGETIKAASDPKLDQAAERAISVSIFTAQKTAFRQGTERNLLVSIDRSQSPELHDVALGLVVDLLCDDRPVRTISFGTMVASGLVYAPSMSGVAEALELDAATFNPADAGRWSLRIRGDREASLYDFGRRRYWAGSYTVPLEQVLTR